MGGLVGSRGRALQVVGLGGHVCVLRLSVLSGWCQALVQDGNSMLTESRNLETHGSGLPAARGLEQTLISPLADWCFMRPWE